MVYPNIGVMVPEQCTEQERNERIAWALYRAAEQLGGVPADPRPAGAPELVVRRRDAVRPPSPTWCRTAPQFIQLMRDLKLWAGVSFEKLEQRAAAQGLSLPHSTIQRYLARGNLTRLPDKDLLDAFAHACMLSENQVREWLAVWAEIQSGFRAAETWWDTAVNGVATGQVEGVDESSPTHYPAGKPFAPGKALALSSLRDAARAA